MRYLIPLLSLVVFVGCQNGGSVIGNSDQSMERPYPESVYSDTISVLDLKDFQGESNPRYTEGYKMNHNYEPPLVDIWRTSDDVPFTGIVRELSGDKNLMIDGKRVGVWKGANYIEGHLITNWEKSYQDGRLVWYREWDENGQLVLEENYENGVKVTSPKSTSLSNTTWITTTSGETKMVYKFLDDSRVSVELVLSDDLYQKLNIERPGPETYSYRISGNKISITGSKWTDGSKWTEVYTMSSDKSYFEDRDGMRHYRSSDFYIINVSAVDSKSRANEEVATLRAQGYDADYLWIPDYPSLSGASYYSVFIGPFETIDDCALAVKEYRKHNPKAYGLLVSDKNKRIEIRGPEKIKIIDPYP